MVDPGWVRGWETAGAITLALAAGWIWLAWRDGRRAKAKSDRRESG